VREILVSSECEEFIEGCSTRIQAKFDYLLAVISEQEIVSKNFVDKLVKTEYYELRIKAENQIRIVVFTIDHENFNQSKKVILLNAFLKRNNKDYVKAIKKADKLLKKYKSEFQ
jgi:hypothetical protein